MMDALKSSILGSPEIFGSVASGRKDSLNFITSHDSKTLIYLVSYNEKHKEANGEKNCVAHKSELSDNCGIKGPTNNSEIRKLRLRKLRILQCLLQFTNVIPMLIVGDEFGSA